MIIGRTKNGIEVVITKDVMKHLDAHPDVDIGHIAEAVRKIDYPGGFFKDSIDLERTIGKSTCVEVTLDDHEDRFFLYRKNRKGPTPFIFNREPRDTSHIVIILRELKPNEYHDDVRCALVTAYYGDLAPMEPWDAKRKNMPREYVDECEGFWITHALIFDPDVIDWHTTLSSIHNTYLSRLYGEESGLC